MKWFGRRAQREGVEQKQAYPELVFITNRPLLAYVTRALRGRPLDGMRWTNSTFWHSATEGEDSTWLRLAGWQRSIIWSGSMYTLLLLLPAVLLLHLFGQTELLLQLLLLHIIASTPVLLLLDRHFRKEHGVRIPMRVEESGSTDEAGSTERSWRMVEIRPGRRSWMEQKVLPLALAVAPQIGAEIRPEQAEQWVTVPRNYLEPAPKGGQVEILLPRSFSPKDPARNALERTVREKLGMKESSATWQLTGRHPRLLLSTPAAPPTSLTFADVEQFIRGAAEYSPFLGLVSEQKALHAELQEDSPHVLLSGGPGSGKSTLMKLIMMQMLHHGWGLVILDWKKTEAFRWAIGLPGVTYLTDIEDIHDFGVRCTEEINSRKSEGLEGKARVMVVRDEWNATAPMLIDYWSNLRALAEPEDKKLMTLRSPALQGLAQLDFAGREWGMHDLLAGQKVSNRVFNGNTDMRECFGIRGLARYTESTKRMLVGNMKPFPKSSTQPGRWTIVAGENVAVCQVPLITGDEARAFAQEGRPNPISPFSSTYFLDGATVDEVAGHLDDSTDATLLDEASTQGILVASDATATTVAVVAPRPMKLVDISTRLDYLEVTHNVLRNATRADGKGDKTFPAPISGDPIKGYEYDLVAVTKWAKRRYAARQAQRENRAVRG